MEKRPARTNLPEPSKRRSIQSILLDHLAPALESAVAELEGLPPPPEKPERKGLLKWVTRIARGITLISLAGVGFAVFMPAFRGAWAQIALFLAVGFVPHWPVGWVARLAVALGEGLREGDHKVGFRNPGALLGIVERPLFLASLLAGFPEFIGVWFLLKGIAGYRVAGSPDRARRTFQLFLLNTAVSFAGVALAWFLWKALGLPPLTPPTTPPARLA